MEAPLWAKGLFLAVIALAMATVTVFLATDSDEEID